MRDHFFRYFGHLKNVQKYFSPGRVNLIGEHIDYNGGYVFPAAIHLGTYGLVAPREDILFRFVSLNFEQDGMIVRRIDQLEFRKEDGWANYAKGILYTLLERGFSIPHGFDLLIKGNLPTASGLSSSASIEVLVTFIANDMYRLELTRQEIALFAQSVENNYMGMHCGIMDQLIITCGKKDRALLINTASLDVVEAKASFEGYQWLVLNTNYKRKTTESKYNERHQQCMDALSILKKKFKVDHLCDINVSQLDKVRKLIKDDVLFRRVRHVITEQQRTLDAKRALDTQDAVTFGQLLHASHQSLKEDYEVTGYHLDTLVEAAIIFGAIGARVTGAGFGGCAIALVPNDKMSGFMEKTNVFYQEKTKLKADFYKVTFVDGVGQIEDESRN
ncbi:MAG: galactokinase [Acholeplasmataceae bacterium]|nr:galactokinase [Acholeplasmataceae bacterium]